MAERHAGRARRRSAQARAQIANTAGSTKPKQAGNLMHLKIIAHCCTFRIGTTNTVGILPTIPYVSILSPSCVRVAGSDHGHGWSLFVLGSLLTKWKSVVQLKKLPPTNNGAVKQKRNIQ